MIERKERVMKINNRERKKFYLIEIVLVLLAAFLFAFFGKWTARFEEETMTDSYVSVKEAALNLEFSVYTKEEWKLFFDAYKEEYLTNEMVEAVMKKLGVSDVISFTGKGKGLQRAVTRMEWYQVYKQLIDYLDISDRVESKEILILNTEAAGNGSSIYTNEGTFTTELPISYFNMWEPYKIYLIGEECVGVETELNQESVIPNAYIISFENDKLSFLFRGVIYEKEANFGEQIMKEGVADLTIKDAKISTIGQKQDFIVGNLLSYDDKTIEIEGYGRIAHHGRVPVYQTYTGVEEKSISDIVLGNMEVKYIVGENEVCAILLLTPAKVQNVRVLLLSNDGGKFRESVYLTSDDTILVSCNKESIQLEPGTVINTSDYLNNEEETLSVTPQLASQYLYFCNENGEKISNPYSGHMEIRKYPQGYCVVNDVPFETYLYSVVPSEMPSNYEMEALKAQAVCARSYAYIQVMRADLAAYGAHINDSTSYQVYNHVAKTGASITAVDETAGEIMMYQGDVIEAFYFSTSMGYTDTAQVWNIADNENYGYLKKVCLNQQEFEGDLSQEADFKLYLTQKVTGFDSNIKYFRWQIKADYKNLTEEIKEVLNSRKAAVKRHITYYKEDGKTETENMKGFGEFKSFSVVSRSEAGSILTLKVEFEHGSAIVKNEYNIRKILTVGAKKIIFQDGSENDTISLLPSAFCTVEKQKDGTYLLCGGGYGHGLGMSQNGANGLAHNGYTYEEILHYFYQNIELANIGE